MAKLMLVLAAAAVAAAMTYRGGDLPAAAPALTIDDKAPAQRQPQIEVFRLARSGHPETCAIAKGDAIGSDKAMLAVEDKCRDIHPDMPRAKRWHDLADGTVELTTEDGEAVARFAPGDGLAYESFEPGSPILSLSVAE